MEEKYITPLRGERFSIIQLAVLLASIWCFQVADMAPLGFVLVLGFAVAFWGYFSVLPGNAMLLFQWGVFQGTVQKAGFYWHVPWLTRKVISMRKQATVTPVLRLADRDWQPVIFQGSVQWRIDSPAKAAFLNGKWESTLLAVTMPLMRSLVQSYPLLAQKKEIALLTHTSALMEAIRKEANKKLQPEGLYVTEVAVWQLNFAPEVAAKNHAVSLQAMEQSLAEAKELMRLQQMVLPADKAPGPTAFVKEYVLKKLFS